MLTISITDLCRELKKLGPDTKLTTDALIQIVKEGQVIPIESFIMMNKNDEWVLGKYKGMDSKGQHMVETKKGSIVTATVMIPFRAFNPEIRFVNEASEAEPSKGKKHAK